MAILVKCNKSDMDENDELTFYFPTDGDVAVAKGDKVFVWASENRRGQPGKGLELRGSVTRWRQVDGRPSVTLKVLDRLSGQFGMGDLGALPSPAAHELHDRIASLRHRKIWALSPAEAQCLDDVFTENAAPPMLILHGIRLNRYQGMDEGFFPGGFKWAAKEGWGGEMFNFQSVNGHCYGHVEVLETSVHIEKLGTDKDADSVDGILAVWTAPDPEKRGRTIVGWYRNATVYRWRQQPKGKLKAKRTYDGVELTYQVEAAAKDCVLLPPEERVLTIPPRKKGDKGIPGQKPVFYPAQQTEPAARLLEQRIRRFIDAREAQPLGDAPAEPDGSRQPDPERRKEIEEEAVKLVWQHFEDLGYRIDDRQRAKCGYDLRATKADSVLCIEVKGRSGTTVAADFTINEYGLITRAEKSKFLEGSYRICIVTDALNESAGAKLHHFWYVPATPDQAAQGKEGEWRNVSSPDVLQLSPMVAARATLIAD